MAAAPALAQHFVNSVADASDGNLSDPQCLTMDGECTLRAAIEQSNFDLGVALIFIDSGFSGSIVLMSGELPISDSVNIQGPGSGVLTVSADSASRVFLIQGAGLIDVSISGLTISNGVVGSDNGGGILGYDVNLTLSDVILEANDAINGGGLAMYTVCGCPSLTISDSIIRNNHAVGGSGGGIYIDDVGTLLVERTEISTNVADLEGGGLFLNTATGNVSVDAVTVTLNTAQTAGGGMLLGVPVEDVTISRSTISGNVVQDPSVGIAGGLGVMSAVFGRVVIQATTINANTALDGAGLVLSTDLQPAVVENTTVSGNDATGGSGGGLFTFFADALTVRHSTIVSNLSDEGGGIFVAGGEAPLLSHTIVANNQSTTDVTDLATCGCGPFDILYSIIGDPGASVNNLDGSLVGVNPALNPLADNGGPTQTHRPIAGSPAVDAGDPVIAFGPINDQRGPGFLRIQGSRIDIGSLETELNDPPIAGADGLAGITEDSGNRTIALADLLTNDGPGGGGDELGQTLTITQVTNGTGGTVAIIGPDVIFTPAADFNGAASFTYTVQDNGQTNGLDAFQTATGLVTFSITEVNDPPVAAADALTSVAEDSGQRTIPFEDLIANDGRGAADEALQTLVVESVGTPVGGTLSIAPPNVLFTPDPNFNGAASFTYMVVDNGTTSMSSNPLTSGPASVTFTVTPVADTLSVTGATTIEDTQTTSGLEITANLVDSEEVTHVRMTGITGGTLFLDDGSTVVSNGTFLTLAQVAPRLRFTPAPNSFAAGSFTVQASTSGSQAGLGGDPVTATITVAPVADTPVVPAGTTTALNTQTGPIVIARNAADGEEVTHFQIASIQNGTLFQNDGTTAIGAGDYVTVAQGAAGLRFTPGANLSDPTAFGFGVQASIGADGMGVGGAVAHVGISVGCEATVAVMNALDAGPDSLRDAIARVCGGGTITFDPAVFLAATSPHAIPLASELSITKSLNIAGPTPAVVTLTGNGTFRLMYITGAEVDVSISNLSFTGGAPQAGQNAGAIEFNNTGTLTLTACDIWQSSPPGTTAIYSNAAAGLVVSGCTVRNNAGQAIAVGQTPTTIANSTFSGNGNAAVHASYTTVSVINSTFADNGAGFYAAAGSTITLSNTLLSRNSNLVNIGGTTISGGHNLLDDASVFTVPNATDTYVSHGAAGLAPLAANGGRTLTRALVPGSPALDAGDSAAAANAGLTTDQRGAGFGRIRDAADPDTTAVVDIGAFEADPMVEAIGSKATAEDTALPTFIFNLGDAATAFNSITATSSNVALVPNAGIVVGADTPSTRTLSMTPAANQNGATTITVTATKTIAGTVVTSSHSFPLTVTAVNDAPVATADVLPAVSENAAPSVIPFALLLANDGRGGGADESTQILTITQVTNGTGGTVAIVGTDVIFSPTPDFNGAASFTYTVRDNGQTNGVADFKTAIGTVSLAITAVNNAPTIAPVGDQVTPLNTALGPIALTIFDPDTAPAALVLTAASSNQALMPDANLTLGGTGTARTITMVPLYGQAGSTIITLTLSDGTATTVSPFTVSVGTESPVQITVLTPGDAPSFVANTPIVTLDGTATSSLPITLVRWTNDRGGQGIASVAGEDGPGSIQWTATIPLQVGANVLTFVARDSLGRTASKAVTVEVNALNYYFAEGSTGAFFDTYILIANPTGQPAEVRATYMTEAGASIVETFTLPARNRISRLVDTVAGLADAAFSTTITSTNGVPLLVERSMYWDGSAYGGSAAAAAEQLSRTWYFGDGSESGPPPPDPARSFDTYVMLGNPGAAPANVTLRFLTEEGAVVTRTRTVLPGGRATVPTIGIAELAGRSFGIVVTSDVPIVAERAQYFGAGYAAGHVSPGMPTLSSVWRFAEGAVGPIFDTYFLVVNPHATPVTLGIAYRLADERRIFLTRVVAPFSRATIRAGDSVPAAATLDFWTTIVSERPVAIDRSMYWSQPPSQWTGSNGSAGVDSPGPQWGFAEGAVGGPMQFETYLLLANPNDTDAAVEVTFLLPEGGTLVRTTTVTAQQRTTIDVGALAPELVNQTFGMVVRSTNGVPLVAERSMYWTVQGVRLAEGSNATGIRIP